MKKLLTMAAALIALHSAYGANVAEDLIKGFEGFRPSVYVCKAGRATIGYGFTSKRMVAKGRVTEAEASAELSRLCKGIALKLRKELGEGNTLKPHEEAALVSFIYNIGWTNFKNSTMCRLLKQGRRGAVVGVEFHKWNKITKDGKKVVLKGLARRRTREARLFLGIA